MPAELLIPVQDFFNELDGGTPASRNSVDAFVSMMETDGRVRDDVILSLIDPNGDDTSHNDVAGPLLKHPRILTHIQHGGTDFQRVADGADLLLRMMTETGDEFSFSDHPRMLALIGYLYWFIGATGPAVMMATMSEMVRPKNSAVHGSTMLTEEDLLPRMTAMLVKNHVTPSHDNAITEADLDMLDGQKFIHGQADEHQ